MSEQTVQVVVSVACGLFGMTALMYIFWPSRDTDTGEDKTRLSYLYERKEVMYDNLRDLNFEYKSGKFTQADYDSMRSGMEAEAARVLAEIEKLESVAS